LYSYFLTFVVVELCCKRISNRQKERGREGKRGNKERRLAAWKEKRLKETLQKKEEDGERIKNNK
jgi:hypothetical protein